MRHDEKESKMVAPIELTDVPERMGVIARMEAAGWTELARRSPLTPTRRQR